MKFCGPFFACFGPGTLIILLISQRQINIDLTEKVWADNFLPGRTLFQSTHVARPAGGLLF